MSEEAPSGSTMKEYLEYLDREETIIGTSSDQECSYPLGYIDRQAVYSCLDCTGLNISAGFCYACSLFCHKDHKVEMLYTKRHFRCDCGTIPQLLCNLMEKPDGEENTENAYNHNFQALYCTCAQPYSDTDTSEMEKVEMYQCTICEDWFHTTHLGATLPEEFEELACESCVDKHTFLAHYRITVEPVDVEGDEETEVTTEETEIKTEGTPKTETSSTKSEDTTVGPSADVSPKRDLEDKTTSPPKRQKLNPCILLQAGVSYKGSCFFPKSFRDDICKCTDCLSLYKSHKIEFISDKNDSLASYEERGSVHRQEEDQELDDMLENLPHQVKCDIARALGGLRETMTGLFRSMIDEQDGTMNSDNIKEAFKQLAETQNIDPAKFDDI